MTFHCGIVGSGLRNLVKTCSRCFLFNYVTNLRCCNCGTYFVIFIAHALEFFCVLLFFDIISLNSVHEVTAVKKRRTSTCFKLFFRILRWFYFLEYCDDFLEYSVRDTGYNLRNSETRLLKTKLLL